MDYIVMTRNLAATALLVVLFFVPSPSVLAHVPHDVVADLKPSPGFALDRTIFALVRGGLFRSTDGGYQWHRQTRGLGTYPPTALAVSPAFTTDETLFLSSTGGGVYRSQDAGRSWMQRSDGLDNLDIALLAMSPQFETDRTVLAVGLRGDLHQTQDAGENWKRILHESFNITALDWEGNFAVVGTGSGEVYLSEDNGTRWRKYTQHPRNLKITCIEVPRGSSPRQRFFIGTEEGGIFNVVGSGNTFLDASEGIPDQHITSLATLYEDGRLILFASTWNDAIFRSEDAGTTWTHYETGLRKSEQADRYGEAHFTRITISNDSTVLLGGFCGVFESSDGGRSWSKLYTIPPHHIVGLDLSPPVDSGFTVAIATYGAGAYSKHDGGASWEINNRGLVTTRLGAMAYSPNYAEDGTIFTGTFNWVLRSTDRGSSWESIPLRSGPLIRIKTQLYSKLGHLRSSRTLRKLKALLEKGTRFLKRQTSGQSEIFETPTVFAISPGFAVDQTVFAGRYPNGLIRSLDGGSTFSLIWEAFGSPVWFVTVSPEYPTDLTLFASLRDGLYRSRDGGESWEQVGVGLDLGQAILAISPQFGLDGTVFAGTFLGLFRTRDRGETWEKLRIVDRNADAPVGGVAISPYFPTDREVLVQIRGGKLYLCRDHEDRLEVVFSAGMTDSEYEFSHMLGFSRDRVPLLKFSPNYDKDNTLYAASMEHLVKSTDRGRTWVEVPRKVRYESSSIYEIVSIEGKWKLDFGQEYSAMNTIYSSESNSKATLRFVGTEISWIGTHGPDRGVAKVFIDGKFQAKVDQYSADREFTVESFRMTGLVPGPHAITIQVEDSRNEKSSGQRVDIDALDVN